MAKIFKFTGYFVDPAGECSKRDVKTALEEVTTNALDIFSHHVEVKEVELGEWDDSHPQSGKVVFIEAYQKGKDRSRYTPKEYMVFQKESKNENH